MLTEPLLIFKRPARSSSESGSGLISSVPYKRPITSLKPKNRARRPIPATVLSSISSNFSAAHQAEIDGFQYTSAVRVAFQSRRFWEQDHNIYGGISWSNQPITQLWYPNYAFGEDQGIILGAYIFGGPPGDSFTNLSPQARLDTTSTQATAVHPEFATESSRGISVAWAKVPFQLGGWGISSPSTLLTPDGNTFFAGEHLSILQGWQEGAILSAYSAIDGIVSRDLAT